MTYCYHGEVLVLGARVPILDYRRLRRHPATGFVA